MENFAARLKNLRKAHGLTQNQLAQKANLTQSHINTWETGRSMPLPNNLIALANVFECSIDYLLDRDVEENLVVKNENRGELLLDDEMALLEMYRQLSNQRQHMALGYISGSLYEQKGALQTNCLFRQKSSTTS